MGKFIFNGISTEELGLVIQTPPNYEYPEKLVDMTHIPGRNGDLAIDTGSFQNVNRTYSVAAGFNGSDKFMMTAESITNWLTTTKGYCRLEDTYDPEVYRLGMYVSSGSFANIYDGGTSANITFNCKPQRYLKSGESCVEGRVTDGSIVVENPTGFPALPIITFENLNVDQNSDSSFTQVVLVTVSDNDNNTISSITLSDIDTTSSITLDSESQKSYNGEESMDSKINLNSKDFPIFKAGKTTVTVKQYTEKLYALQKYNNVILSDNRYKVCKAVYSPQDSVILQRQNKYYIPSINSLKSALQKSFYMEPYSMLCQEKAETYKVESFNDLMNDYGDFWTVDLNNSDEIGPSWMTIEKVETIDGDGKVTARTTTLTCNVSEGGYFLKPGGNKLEYVANGGQIATSNKLSGSLSVYYYPAVIVNNKHNLAIGYNNLPEWLTMSIVYNDNTNDIPKQIEFKVAKKGYFYSTKKGLLNSTSAWSFGDVGDVLNTIVWKTWKKAFAPSGLSISTDTSFTYIYIDSENEMPQYSDVVETKTNSDGSTYKNIVCPNLFRIAGNIINPTYTTKFSGYYRFNNDDSENPQRGWKYYPQNADVSSELNRDVNKDNQVYYIEADSDNPSSVIDFTKNQNDWPDWIDPVPELLDSDNSCMLNAKHVKFKVLATSNYRYTIPPDSDDEEETWSEWVSLNPNDYCGKICDDGEAFSLARIDVMPQVYTDSMAYNEMDLVDFYNSEGGESNCYINVVYSYSSDVLDKLQNLLIRTGSGVTYVTKEDWEDKIQSANFDINALRTLICDSAIGITLTVVSESGASIKRYRTTQGHEFTMSTFSDYLDSDMWFTSNVFDVVESKFESNSSDAQSVLKALKIDPISVIKFVANKAGLFKWDSGSIWLPKEVGDDLVVSKKNDDTTIFYIPSLPEYPSTGLYNVEIKPSLNVNPTEVVFTAATEGYYRVNNKITWQYLKVGDVLLSTEPGTENQLYHLEDSGSITGLQINYIPRWWKL